jgi:hypothetical protein
MSHHRAKNHLVRGQSLSRPDTGTHHEPSSLGNHPLMSRMVRNKSWTQQWARVI